MSGRLIILPKKSWHPGKRENIEKVLRDERIAAEEAEAARNRAREIAQEGIVETLARKRSASEKSKDEAKATAAKPSSRKRTRQGEDKDHKALGGKGQGWGAKLQHVNLFSDAEREATKLLGQNADHQREKKEQELQTQKRSGLAPTALGEGSAELKDKDAQPWYTQLQASSRVTEAVARTVRLGREVTGQEAEEAIKRDQGRKGRADPLGSLFRSGAQTAVTMREMNQSKASSLELPGGARVGLDEDAIRVDEKKPSAEGKNAKKDKRHKKGKKRKKKSCKKRRKGSEQDSNGCESPGGEEDSRDVQRQQSLKELRSRRLAREGGERDREIRLLAEREMAGQSLPDERSRAYNNQYNAPAARQNRRP